MSEASEQNDANLFKIIAQDHGIKRAVVGVVLTALSPFLFAGLSVTLIDPVKTPNLEPKEGTLFFSMQNGNEIRAYTKEGEVLYTQTQFDLQAGFSALSSGETAVSTQNATLILNKDGMRYVTSDSASGVESEVVCDTRNACRETNQMMMLGVPCKAERQSSPARVAEINAMRDAYVKAGQDLIERAQARFQEAKNELKAPSERELAKIIKPLKAADLYAFTDDDSLSGFMDTRAGNWRYVGGNDKVGAVSFSLADDATMKHEQLLAGGTRVTVTCNASGNVQVEQLTVKNGRTTRLVQNFDDETQQVTAYVDLAREASFFHGLSLKNRADVKPQISPREMSEIFAGMNKKASRLEDQILMGKDVPEALPREEGTTSSPILRDDQGTFGLKALSSLLRKAIRLG